MCVRERARARSSALTGSLAKQAEAEQGERWADSVIGKLEEQRTLSSTLYIVYRLMIPHFLHFEPSLDASSLRSDVIG